MVRRGMNPRVRLTARLSRFGDSQCLRQKRNEVISTSLETPDTARHEQQDRCEEASRQRHIQQVGSGQFPSTNGGDRMPKGRRKEHHEHNEDEPHHAKCRAMKPDLALEARSGGAGSGQSTAEERVEGVSTPRSEPQPKGIPVESAGNARDRRYPRLAPGIRPQSIHGLLGRAVALERDLGRPGPDNARGKPDHTASIRSHRCRLVAPPDGFEPPTPALGRPRSIH
jgi:hypothetical protein